MDFVLIPLHLPLDLPGKQEVGGGGEGKAHPSSGNAGHAADG